MCKSSDTSDINYILVALQEMGRLGIEAGIVGQNLKEELMDDKQVGESWIGIYDSLLKAVDDAGGANGPYRYDLIKDITVGDLFNRIATNHIRFICTKLKCIKEKR